MMNLTYLDSKFFGGYQVPYKEMLYAISEKEYFGFFQYRDELEELLRDRLKSYEFNYSAYPNEHKMLQIETEQEPIFIPHSPHQDPKEINEENGEPFLIGKISSHYPLKRREKPSGIIFLDDWSFLQFEQIVAWSLIDQKMYMLTYSYHYGRIKDTQEVYHFRFDKESDFEFVEINSNSKIQRLIYKPMNHFHGNSDDPHFPDGSWGNDLIKHLLELLKINLPRLMTKYGVCDTNLP